MPTYNIELALDDQVADTHMDAARLFAKWLVGGTNYQVTVTEQDTGDAHNIEVYSDGTVEDDDSCACGASLNDGEGYDGACGNCADKAENEHEDSRNGSRLQNLTWAADVLGAMIPQVVTWEYPGYICVKLSGDRYAEIGDNGDVGENLGMEIQSDEGSVLEAFTIEANARSTPAEIAAAVQKALVPYVA